MLLAMAMDLAALENVALTVAVCAAAHNELPSLPGVAYVCVENVDEASFAESVLRLGPFTDVFPIAPEIDGVLAMWVREFRTHGQHVVAASEATIQLGADKWQLFQFLKQHEIATIPTIPGRENPSPDFADPYVVKPTDGAGCEGVRRMTRVEFDAFRAPNPPASNTIIQPFIVGQSYSVGLIGQGAGSPPLILPVATQDVEWVGHQPRYRGGSLPVVLSSASETSLRHLLNQLLQFVVVDSGYVGIDLLKPDDSTEGEWLIVEINPRLCTSYIGYRQATKSNLARFLLGHCGDAVSPWKETPVVFSCESSPIEGYNS